MNSTTSNQLTLFEAPAARVPPSVGQLARQAWRRPVGKSNQVENAIDVLTAIIGGMAHGQYQMAQKVIDLVQPEDFEIPIQRAIFEAAVIVYQRRCAVGIRAMEPRTIVAEMRRRGVAFIDRGASVQMIVDMFPDMFFGPIDPYAVTAPITAWRRHTTFTLFPELDPAPAEPIEAPTIETRLRKVS